MDKQRSPIVPDETDGQIIDLNPFGLPKRRKRGRWLLILALLALLFALSRAASIYVETLWFGSPGYGTIYWTTFKYELALFVIFALATAIILRCAFWLMERALDVSALATRRILLRGVCRRRRRSPDVRATLFFASRHERSGGAQLFSESVATFGLLSVIWGCARLRSQAVPFAVAAYIVAAYWFTASTSFANPAVTLARAASNTFAGIRPADTPGFIVAQLLGAFAATYLFRWLVPTLPEDAGRVVVPHNGKDTR